MTLFNDHSKSLLLDHHELKSESLDSEQLAYLFVTCAYLCSCCQYLDEMWWLEKSQPESSYSSMLDRLLKDEALELRPIGQDLKEMGLKGLKKLKKRAKNLANASIEAISLRTPSKQRIYLESSLQEMMKLFRQEEAKQQDDSPQAPHRGPCLYRSFDPLDSIFQLDYSLDHKMAIDRSNPERLYQGSGVGVQSGYSTILLALHHAQLKKGDRVIDLGSGYGRVGLCFALLRNDLEFIGYEYVSHRVEVAQECSQQLGLSQSLEFVTQDLSDPKFALPVADLYYLYDPFCKKTYEFILEQIRQMANKKPIKIVTKGNARAWLSGLAKEEGWPEPAIFDEGNLCIYHTHEN